MIGFPIPERFGGAPVRMHWIGFLLPVFTGRRDSTAGFRPTRPARIEQDRRALRGLRQLEWFRSESWSDEDLTGRGRLPESLTGRHVLLLGAGAVGSVVAELLVRGGVRKLTVIDAEDLEAGNLVRHMLDLRHVGQNKAKALAQRLTHLAPAVDALGLDRRFPDIPTRDQQRIQSAEIVIDATAADAVLGHLEELDWPGERIFVSLSMGLGCRRLYLFAVRGRSFPRAAFVEAVAPWVEADWQDVDELELPRGGAGCWQPLMPGAHFEVTMLAGAAIEVIQELLIGGGPSGEPRLVVLEQQREDGRFVGVRRVSTPPRPAAAG